MSFPTRFGTRAHHLNAGGASMVKAMLRRLEATKRVGAGSVPHRDTRASHPGGHDGAASTTSTVSQ